MFAKVFKANPYHDAEGKFATKGTANAKALLAELAGAKDDDGPDAYKFENIAISLKLGGTYKFIKGEISSGKFTAETLASRRDPTVVAAALKYWKSGSRDDLKSMWAAAEKAFPKSGPSALGTALGLGSSKAKPAHQFASDIGGSSSNYRSR